MSTSQDRFEDRVVAFVDILGFRNIVEGMANDPKSFELIRDVLKTIHRQERKISSDRLALERASRQRKPRVVSLLPPSRTEMTAFSDCYVISDKVASGWKVLVVVQAIAVSLLYRGILLRGGIVRGKAYHSGSVLFGPGVISAYELEDKAAAYPRIVVEDHLLRSESLLLAKGEFFLRDADGCWFVNPFELDFSHLSALLPGLRPNRAERDFLDRVRMHVVRLLSAELRTRRRKWDRIAKLRWLATRFNNAVAAHPAGGVPPIDLDRPRMLAGASARA